MRIEPPNQVQVLSLTELRVKNIKVFSKDEYVYYYNFLVAGSYTGVVQQKVISRPSTKLYLCNPSYEDGNAKKWWYHGKMASL
jgi:hypothetical protein